MMKKQIHASNAKIVSTVNDFEFPVGAKYLQEGIQYTVRKAYNESSQEMRLVFSDSNQEEIRLLAQLQADSKKKNFSVIFTPPQKKN